MHLAPVQNTALHWAIACNHQELVTHFLQVGASPHLVNCDKMGLEHLACYLNFSHLLPTLLDSLRGSTFHDTPGAVALSSCGGVGGIVFIRAFQSRDDLRTCRLQRITCPPFMWLRGETAPHASVCFLSVGLTMFTCFPSISILWSRSGI